MFFFAAKLFITASVSLFVIDMITLFILFKFHLRKDYIARNLFISSISFNRFCNAGFSKYSQRIL